jgi:flagellar basal body-associated protein FliL
VVEWQTVIALVSAMLVFMGLNLGAMQWMLNRHDAARGEAAAAIGKNRDYIALLETKLLELRAELPMEYVRREDWIRISNTLEAKLDAMRAELREEQQRLRGELTGKIDELSRAAN